jgi:hypothetical protein
VARNLSPHGHTPAWPSFSTVLAVSSAFPHAPHDGHDGCRVRGTGLCASSWPTNHESGLRAQKGNLTASNGRSLHRPAVHVRTGAIGIGHPGQTWSLPLLGFPLGYLASIQRPSFGSMRASRQPA